MASPDSGTANATFYEDGRLMTRTYARGKLFSYFYDDLGRLTKVTYASGTPSQYEYDAGLSTANGKLQSQTYPSLARLNYAYDSAGRLLRITLNPVKTDGSATNANQTITLLRTIGYSPLNQVKNWLWGSTTVAYERSFDSAGRLSSYPLGTGKATGLTRTITYDDAGRIASFTHANASGAMPAFDQVFAHDGLDRLGQ